MGNKSVMRIEQACRCGGRPRWQAMPPKKDCPQTYRIKCYACGRATAAAVLQSNALAQWNGLNEVQR